MTARTAARLAWSLWALAVVLGVGELGFSILNRDTDVAGSSGPLLDTVFVVVVLVFPTVGALVASRRPRHPIGWILVGAGVSLALSGLAEGYGVYALYTAPGAVPGATAMAWISSWIFIAPLFAAPALLFLLFPDGRPPSPRWRPVVWSTAAATGAAVIGGALAPARLDDPPFRGVVNPVALESAEWLFVVSGLGWAGMVGSILAAATSMVLRLRRSRGVERQQLKWIAAAAAVFAVACLGGVGAYFAGQDEVGSLVIVLALLPIPIATGLAILRHRLYDIDVVINRALVYGALSALLAGAYVGGVLLFGLVVRPLTGSSNLAIAGSTLAVAALVRPARARIQSVVDRRFYRRRYDAARTLESFGARLRDEVDLDALGRDLRGVVRETLQPAHVSLWLRAGEGRR